MPCACSRGSQRGQRVTTGQSRVNPQSCGRLAVVRIARLTRLRFRIPSRLLFDTLKATADDLARGDAQRRGREIDTAKERDVKTQFAAR
jgi:hypothetical protein